MSVCSLNKEVTEFLLSHQLVDVNSRDSFQRTALHYAASLNGTEVAEVLLKYGADINALTIAKETPLFKACLFGQTEMIELLLSRKDTLIDIKDSVDFSYPVLQLTSRPAIELFEHHDR